MNKFFFGFTYAVIVTCCFHLPAHAFLGDVKGVGMRASSMGEAFVAIADDYSAAYYNPAGLGQITDELRITFDIMYEDPQFKVKETATGQELRHIDYLGREVWNPTKYSDTKRFGDLSHNLPTVGITGNLKKICSALNFKKNITAGAVIMLPNSFEQMMVLADYVPDIPQFTRFGDYTEQLFFVFSVGVEWYKDLLYIGLGGRVGIYGDGDVHNNDAGVVLQGNQLDLPPEDKAMVFQMQVDWRVFANLGPVIGVLYTPFDKKLKIGATYREQTAFDIGPCPLMMNYRSSPADQAASIPWNGLLEFFFGYAPQEIALGVAYEFGDITVSGGIEFQKWSKFFYAATIKNQYFHPEWNLGYLPSTPDFDDVINTSLGIEYRLNDKITLMGGYQNMPTPVPDQSDRITNFLDMDKHSFSLGGSYALIKDFIKVGASLGYMFCDDLKVNKEGVVGWAFWDSGSDNDQLQKSYSVKGDVFSACLSAEVNF